MTTDEMIEMFGEPISTYSRAQAIDDGVLVEVPADLLAEASFRFPIAFTASAWVEAVQVTEDSPAGQDEAGRLWDVLTVLKFAINRSRGGDTLRFPVSVAKRGGRRTVKLVSKVGPGDHMEPVITIDVEVEG